VFRSHGFASGGEGPFGDPWCDGEQQTNQLIIKGDEILPDDLQRRAHGIRNDHQRLLHFPNTAADLQLKLAIAVAMAVRIRLLLSEKLEGGANVVRYFSKMSPRLCNRRLARFGGGFKLGQAQFVECLDPGCRMGIAIKMILQLLDLVGGKKR